MGVRGSSGQSDVKEVYSENQIAAVLEGIGIKFRGETVHDFTCLCPFHGNRNTPSLSVSKKSGEFICFNPSCGKTGNLVELVMGTTSKNQFEALRFIIRYGTQGSVDLTQRLRDSWAPTTAQTEFPQETIDRMAQDFWDSPAALEYMRGRGFTDETLERYMVGWSEQQKMVVVPAHSIDGRPIGVIGRSIIDKRFKNSNGLHTSQFLFNIHRARKVSNWVIINESSFDTMKIEQAGFPNVVGTLGGSFGKEKVRQIMRNFDEAVIMTDFDELQFPKPGVKCHRCAGECEGHNPGRDLGYIIASRLAGMSVAWATIGYKNVYGGAKDAMDMSEEDIVKAIKNRTPHLEYVLWNVY